MNKHKPLSQQHGSAIMLTVLIMLIMMTMMLFFNGRVTLFEQAVSGNDRRAKLSHHAAEAGVSHAVRYLNENKELLISEGAGGWLADASSHWTQCTADHTDLPCAAAPLDADGRSGSFTRENVYFYDFGESTTLPMTPTIDEFAANDDYQVQALLCVVDFDPDTFDVADPATYAECDTNGTVEDPTMAVKLIATGWSDDGSSEAIVEEVYASVLPGTNAPHVPLMTTSAIDPQGTISIIANPNGGGLGVPASIWAKNAVDIEDGASTSTCEYEDFLNDRASSFWTTHTFPDGETVAFCDSCKCPDKEADGALSHSNVAGESREYVDILDNDTNYPDDLFEYYFGVPRSAYETVRESAAAVYPNCSSVGAGTGGITWIDGLCDMPSNSVIGSPDNPIVLVATGGLDFNANSVLYGVLLIVNPKVAPDEQEAGSIQAKMNGGVTVYGAVMTDPGGDPYNGNFTIAYNEAVLKRIQKLTLLGALPGSWSDLVTSR